MKFGLRDIIGLVTGVSQPETSALNDGKAETQQAARARLKFSAWPAAVYAIGDVHGCRNELLALLDRIVADASEVEGEKWIIGLGDYVDRGPESAGVIDTLCNWQRDGFRTFWLAGNHDVLMYDAITGRGAYDRWQLLEGDATLRSYDLDPATLKSNAPARQAILDRHVPERHRDFLKSLPVMLELPGVIFVHAGIRSGVPLDLQTEADLIWMRPRDGDASDPSAPLVVHGHTPGPSPVILPHRICVDTGVYVSGVCTAVRLTSRMDTKFITNR